MKKFLVVFLVLFVTVSFTAFGHGGGGGGASRDYHDGITAGVEFGVFEADENGDQNPNLAFTLAFAHPFFDDQLELLAEMRYIIGLGDDWGDGDSEHAMDLYLGLTWNRQLSDASKLSFILHKGFEGIVLTDRDDDTNNIDAGKLTPAFRFEHEFPVGDTIYFQSAFPWTYLRNNTPEAARLFGADFTLGWESNFGLNLETTLRTLISPFSNAGPDANPAWRNTTGIQFLEFVVGYEYRAFYFEVATEVPVNASNRNAADAARNPGRFGASGLVITPEIEFHIHALGGVLTAYVNCEFDHAFRYRAVKDKRMHISPAVGLMYTYEF